MQAAAATAQTAASHAFEPTGSVRQRPTCPDRLGSRVRFQAPTGRALLRLATIDVSGPLSPALYTVAVPLRCPSHHAFTRSDGSADGSAMPCPSTTNGSIPQSTSLPVTCRSFVPSALPVRRAPSLLFWCKVMRFCRPWRDLWATLRYVWAGRFSTADGCRRPPLVTCGGSLLPTSSIRAPLGSAVAHCWRAVEN